MKRSLRCSIATVCVASSILTPSMARAHAFGQRYDLPFPLSYYISAAGLTVFLSFIIMALFGKGGSGKSASNTGAKSLEWRAAAFLLLPVKRLLQTLSLLCFFLLLLAGFIGEPSPTRNFAPTFIWVIWWVGFAYLQALLGNIWAVVNPWHLLYSLAERLAQRLGEERFLSGWVQYPQWLSYWPAVLFFWSFAWIEQVSQAAEEPGNLARLILAYSLFTWAGMFLFGREVWLRRGEAFSLVFGLLARFAPLTAGPRQVLDEDERGKVTASDSRREASCVLRLRPYGLGLLPAHPLDPAAISLVVLMLASVTFDGVKETPLWAGFLDWITLSPWLREPLLYLQGTGINLIALIQTLGLLVVPITFVLVYYFFALLTARSAGGGASSSEAAGAFVLTLVPIAIAYHLAHYFSFLLLAGQLIIPLISDPFGFGWNLFGSADYTLDVTVIKIRTVWWLAAAAVVIGHIFAVTLGHAMALRLYGAKARAIRSQIPLTGLMVCYTMLSLWILSQPIIQTG